MSERQETAIIIGAGPAGLTAAYELLTRTNIKPIVLEATMDVGGISRTVNYRGNRIDIGGHRFFSKSDRVMAWWQSMMPVYNPPTGGIELRNDSHDGQKNHELHEGPEVNKPDTVMLVRTRLSRILFLRKFFDYPISLSLNTIRNMGLSRLFKVALSYAWICLTPRRSEKSLEDFFINRFGRELYRTFFKDYTEKVWGVPCSQIKPEWGAQRVKGLSITKAVGHAIKKMMYRDRSIGQKDTETTLIEQFLYPKFGPGQMWETVAGRIRELGGDIRLGHRVTDISMNDSKITEIEVRHPGVPGSEKIVGEYVFSTMPVRDLILSLRGNVPRDVREVAEGLVYRDFITVGMLLSKMSVKPGKASGTAEDRLLDNWIYIQEPDVKVGRLQIFNNWSPHMVRNPENVWIGLEYFCNEGDELWIIPDESLVSFAIDELVTIGLIDRQDFIDGTVIRTTKTYPAYWGTYNRFCVIREFTDRIENLFLIGRNGMHKYNNQDHSMLTAMTAVDNLVNAVKSKSNIWAVNTEQGYHESKT